MRQCEKTILHIVPTTHIKILFTDRPQKVNWLTRLFIIDCIYGLKAEIDDTLRLHASAGTSPSEDDAVSQLTDEDLVLGAVTASYRGHHSVVNRILGVIPVDAAKLLVGLITELPDNESGQALLQWLMDRADELNITEGHIFAAMQWKYPMAKSILAAAHLPEGLLELLCRHVNSNLKWWETGYKSEGHGRPEPPTQFAPPALKAFVEEWKPQKITEQMILAALPDTDYIPDEQFVQDVANTFFTSLDHPSADVTDPAVISV